MKHSGTSIRILAFVLALTALAGCKSVEEEAETEDGATDAPASSDGSPPSIWGDPATDIVVGSQYVFVPESFDDDGDVLEFAIANKPAWAAFDTSSGELQGMPADNDVGTDPNIVISVSDDTSVVSLPSFSITVNPVESPDDGGDDGGSTSSPPAISGQPNDSVVVDSEYSFQPDASDPDGDTLSFSIVNKPEWASFSTVTGRLEGTPVSADVGTTDGIELSVSDGDNIDALNPFSITVVPAGPTSFTVSWTAPATNDDGSPLTDLAGYNIYYGTVSGEYNEAIEVTTVGVTSYRIENLSSGTYFLVMTSVNSAHVESDYSEELSFELGT